MTATPERSTVEALVELGIFGPAERFAADLIGRRWSVDDDHVLLATALAVWADRTGHVGVDLHGLDAALTRTMRDRSAAAEHAGIPALPDPATLREALVRRRDVVRVLEGDPGAHHAALADMSPLVLWRERLYSQRQFVDERSIAEQVVRRAGSVPAANDAARALLDRIAGDLDPSQRRAVDTALDRRFTVITGGPGTGKTFTLVRVLAALLAADSDLEIVLAAPTGKAAKRMQEAIASAIGPEFGDIGTQLAALAPTTIHGLLGARGRSTRFRRDADNPLTADVVVIDEASMVSMQIMARCLEAVRPDARVVLLGDPNQLASVEAGSVLADISAATAPAVRPSILELDTGHRAGDAIVELARAIQTGDRDQVVDAFGRNGLTLITTDTADPRAVREALAAGTAAATACRDEARMGHGAAAHRSLLSHRVLCGHRHGPTGVSTWNAWFERAIGCAGSTYAGRPVLVTLNDPITGLVNGDTGILVDRDGEIVAWFPPAEPDGEARTFAPVQLPPTETAFAMTIHKSQGSEYDHVVVMLPPPGSPLLTRELLYTAVTRAKRSVTVIGSAEALETAVTTVTERASGLREALSG
ncbi:MAG: exodeoxyribonuclease V subunit alpha [Actinomycetes bacterium]